MNHFHETFSQIILQFFKIFFNPSKALGSTAHMRTIVHLSGWQNTNFNFLFTYFKNDSYQYYNKEFL